MSALAYRRNGVISVLSDHNMLNPRYGTARLVIKTGPASDNVDKYGFTSDSSAKAYCNLRFIIGGKQCYIGRSSMWNTTTQATIQTSSVATKTSTIQTTLYTNQESATNIGYVRYTAHESRATGTVAYKTLMSSTSYVARTASYEQMIVEDAYRKTRSLIFKLSISNLRTIITNKNSERSRESNSLSGPTLTNVQTLVSSNGQTYQCSQWVATQTISYITSRTYSRLTYRSTSEREGTYYGSTTYSSTKNGTYSRISCTLSYSMVAMSNTTYLETQHYTTTTSRKTQSSSHNFNM